jgi:hypothetical protein
MNEFIAKWAMRRWSLEEVVHWGHGFNGYVFVPDPFLCFSLPPAHHEVSHFLYNMLPTMMFCLTTYRP